MRFIFFTDIHLLENTDSIIGFEKCLDRMIAFEPELLINGGDLGVTPKAVEIYYRMIDSLPIPVYHVNGNHEICNGHLDGERSGQFSYSFDFGGVHFVILETVRFFNPTTEHPQNWYFIVDQQDLEWLNSDLNLISKETPIILASHCSISTSAPNRFGQKIGMKFPINEVMNADQVVELLKPFDNVATLHGHDHENCRHRLGNIQILTTAAVSGSWWKNGLQSANVSGEPQGFRLIDITSDQIVSQYITILESQSQLADWYMQEEQDRYFINVFDASPQTKVEIENIGRLDPLDPFSESSKGLSPHLYELSKSQIAQIGSSERIGINIEFEHERTNQIRINGPAEKWKLV